MTAAQRLSQLDRAFLVYEDPSAPMHVGATAVFAAAPLRNDAGIVENLADLAALHSDAGNSVRALDETRAALALLRSSVGERHPLGIELQRNLCSLQR